MKTNATNQYKALPTLDAKTAVKQALKQLYNFNGRARRSEFFWFVLAFLICNMALGLIYNSLMPILPATILGIVLNIFVVPITRKPLRTIAKIHRHNQPKHHRTINTTPCLTNKPTYNAAKHSANWSATA